MEIYKKMYYRLFNAITDAIEVEDKEKAFEILKNAQIETEELFMRFGE